MSELEQYANAESSSHMKDLVYFLQNLHDNNNSTSLFTIFINITIGAMIHEPVSWMKLLYRVIAQAKIFKMPREFNYECMERKEYRSAHNQRQTRLVEQLMCIQQQ